MESKGKSHKNKGKYVQNKKSKYGTPLGTRGILATCMSHNDKSVVELCNLFNEVHNQFY